MSNKRRYIPDRLFGFHFSSNADRSANDYTIYVEGTTSTVILGARYKNSEHNELYTMVMNKRDLLILAKLLTALSEQMEDDESAVETV